MYTVRLNQIKYHVNLGLYEQEKLVDNTFELSVEVSLDKSLSKNNQLEDLIDYVFLKDVCDQYMSMQFSLLEDVLAHIRDAVQEKYSNAKGYISIKKCPPPFGGNVQSAEVILNF